MEFVAGFDILCCKFINLDKTAVFHARQAILKHFLKKLVVKYCCSISYSLISYQSYHLFGKSLLLIVDV